MTAFTITLLRHAPTKSDTRTWMVGSSPDSETCLEELRKMIEEGHPGLNAGDITMLTVLLGSSELESCGCLGCLAAAMGGLIRYTPKETLESMVKLIGQGWILMEGSDERPN